MDEGVDSWQSKGGLAQSTVGMRRRGVPCTGTATALASRFRHVGPKSDPKSSAGEGAALPAPALRAPPPANPCPPHRSRAWGARCRSSGTPGKVSPKGSPRPPRSSLACRVPFPDCRAAEEETVNSPPPPPPLAPPKQDGAKFGPWEGTGPRRGWGGRGVRRGLQEGGGGCAHTGLRRGAGTRETPRLWGAEGTRSAGERTVPRSGCGEPGDRGRAAP